MGSREWTFWLAYMDMYPWGDDWEQAAMVAWSGVAPHTKRTCRIDEFLPTGMRSEQTLSRAMTPEQIKAVLVGRK